MKHNAVADYRVTHFFTILLPNLSEIVHILERDGILTMPVTASDMGGESVA